MAAYFTVTEKVGVQFPSETPRCSIKCIYCGRFMSYEEIQKEGFRFTPDSEYTYELLEFWHDNCNERLYTKS